MNIDRIQPVPFDHVSASTLATLLKMNKSVIDDYIDMLIRKHFQNLTPEEIKNIGPIRAYIYKQGIISQILEILEFELSDVRTTLTFLYGTLENNSGGLADFLSSNRGPLSNAALSSIHSVITKSVKKSADAGYIRQSETEKIAQWALARIYELQNNPQVVHAMDLYRSLKY